MVKMLVEQGVNPTHLIPAFGATAMDVACANGFEEVYYYLGSLGAANADCEKEKT
jgi:hypothetical protein